MASFDRPRAPESGVSAWVSRFAPLIRPGGQVLDVAAGRGRHSRWLLSRGYRVTAVDIDCADLAELQSHPQCRILERDLEQPDWPFAADEFAGILVCNYLHRPHFPRLAGSLAADGVLIIDTFAVGNERYGRPRNPDFLLQPGELLTAFAGALRVVAYECGFEESPRPAVRQRLCAMRGSGIPALRG